MRMCAARDSSWEGHSQDQWWVVGKLSPGSTGVGVPDTNEFLSFAGGVNVVDHGASLLLALLQLATVSASHEECR